MHLSVNITYFIYYKISFFWKHDICIIGVCYEFVPASECVTLIYYIFNISLDAHVAQITLQSGCSSKQCSGFIILYNIK